MEHFTCVNCGSKVSKSDMLENYVCPHCFNWSAKFSDGWKLNMKYILFVHFKDENVESMKKGFNTQKELDDFILPLLYENQIRSHYVYVKD